MQEKYLPIGSIVTIKNTNRKIMIIGYYSLEYQNSVKIYDYVGCNYPEGMLMKNNMFSFNHSDILKCDFLGFKDASYETFNKNLNSQLNTDTKGMEQPKNFLNLKFDENGVVVYEELSPVKKPVEIVRSVPVTNPFDNKQVTPTAKSKAPEVKNAFKFDENGVVIEDNTVQENKKDIESNFKFTFDENGFVIGEERIGGEANKNTDATKENSSNASSNPSEIQFLFDENGYVIGEQPKNAPKASQTDTKPKPKYTFDENGVVTSDSAEEMLNVPPKKSEQPKEEIKIPHYRFDENGVIISE